ncbi:MAG TPA: cation:proton antiporter [Candidatus Lustribacter sp.]|nr:cation:proton antiporter [Candidatus Lustribacter sp.]
MTAALAIVAIAAGVLAGAALGRRTGVPTPLVLVVAGMAASFVPGFPAVVVEPDIILLGLLPPLLYAAAIRTSLIDLGRNRRNIGLLAVGLVLFTAIGVGLVIWWLLPVPFPLALALGGVVAPPDAVAASAVARRIGLPRAIVSLLEAESLFNDATALVVVRLAIIAAAGSVSVTSVSASFLVAAGGGIAIGLVAAWVISHIRRRLTDTVSETALGFLVPWVAYLPAETVHASGVLAVVVCGVLLGHKAPLIQSATSRVAERINWTTIQFLLENAVFLLIGLQARPVVSAVGGSPLGWPRIAGAAVAVLAAVILLRFLWIVPLHLLIDRIVVPGLRHRVVGAVLVSWAGMRGVVTLAAAFLLPVSTHRDVLILIALAVTAGTLLLQGLTLPMLARRLDAYGPDPREDALQAATVLQRAVSAGRAELDSIADETTPDAVVQTLRAQGERRTNVIWERLGADREVETPSETYRRLRLAMLDAERRSVLELRARGAVEHDVLEEVLRTLDLEETMLLVVSGRTDRLAERVVRTPERVSSGCEHLDAAPTRVTPLTPDGCPECRAEGTTTVHLRLCLTCGHVGCCDSSVGRHATRHNAQTGHPVIRSFEPGEAWRWCFPDEILG